MDTINSSIVLIMIIVITSIGIGLIALLPSKKIYKTETPSKKVFKLFNNDGVLIREYKDVFVTHWDGNIYFLYHEYEGERFITIDKGDMLLSIEKIKNMTKERNNG